jgi:hypothetical protein
MPRVLLTIVLPLLLPTALYLVWVGMLRRPQRNGVPPWAALPWMWLAGAGIALLTIVLFVVTVHLGAQQEGVYVAPRWQDGHIVPGHIEPKSDR